MRASVAVKRVGFEVVVILTGGTVARRGSRWSLNLLEFDPTGLGLGN